MADQEQEQDSQPKGTPVDLEGGHRCPEGHLLSDSFLQGLQPGRWVPCEHQPCRVRISGGQGTGYQFQT